MNRNKIFENVVSGFGGQLLVIILGLIIPRIIIISYGSDTNGLIGTVTQIFTYLSLLEAGIGQAARNAIYKPIVKNDKGKINEVLQAAKGYYKKITVYYTAAVIAVSLIAPFAIKTDNNSIVVFLIVILEGMSGVVSFYYIETPVIMLNADGKSYINNIINLSNKILAYALKLVMAFMGINIVILQFAYFVITVQKVLIYRLYFRHKYPWVHMKASKDRSLLKDRNAYVLTEIAWTIFSSTDMIVLSTFVCTQLSSVYSIYNMIYTNISLLLSAVGNSVLYILGQVYHRDFNEYEKVHDTFNTIFLTAITILMSVCYTLNIPFVRLYTKGITDIDYIYPQLPLMFALVQMFSWSRYIPGNLTGVAGYAKQTSYISLIEAITNLSLSIIFVNKFGIVGVTLATVIALPIKVIWCTYVADKKVMKRSYWKSISIIGVNFLFFLGVVFLSRFYQPTINSYGQFFMWGIILTVVFGIVGMGLNFLVNKDCWQVIRRYIIKR